MAIREITDLAEYRAAVERKVEQVISEQQVFQDLIDLQPQQMMMIMNVEGKLRVSIVRATRFVVGVDDA